MQRRTAVLLLGGLALSACASTCQSGSDRVPAVLVDERATEDMKAILGSAIGRAQFELGTPLPTEAATVVVLPPRLTVLEGASPSMPVVFDITMDEEGCMLTERKGEKTIALPRQLCRPY